MSNAWGGYANGDIPESAMRKVAGESFEPRTATVMQDLLNRAAEQGVNIKINEGYRPLGVRGDMNVRNESQTASGRSTQWFQWGRYQRGETPAAGWPGTSVHGWGMAADIEPGRNNGTVRAIAESLGLIFTIGSEPWHLAYSGGGSSFNANGAQIQGLLNTFGYKLAVDGIVGPVTMNAIVDFQKKNGLVADGIVGPKTMAVLEAGPKPTPAPGGLVVDGVLGPQTYKALQKVLGVSADGVFGPVSKKALQGKLSVRADGVIGPQTVRALQARLGVAQDGDWGPKTTKALQAALNAGSF
jgi:peptidoglycan hydrolase-like protein with peptidoglycan-binding domain